MSCDAHDYRPKAYRRKGGRSGRSILAIAAEHDAVLRQDLARANQTMTAQRQQIAALKQQIAGQAKKHRGGA